MSGAATPTSVPTGFAAIRVSAVARAASGAAPLRMAGANRNLAPVAAAPVEVETDIVKMRVSRILFRNAENGYTIAAGQFRGRRGDSSAKLTIAQNIEVGDDLSLRGTWGSYNGKPQFQASSASILVPKDARGVARWLKKGVEGVGDVTVDRLVQFFGARLSEVVDNREALQECPQLSEQQARNIVHAWELNQDQNELMGKLLSYNLKENQARSIIEKYGAAFQAVLEHSPWDFADIPGIGFETADAVAMQAGHQMGSSKRVKAGLKWVLEEETSSSGNCGMRLGSLVDLAVSRLDVPLEMVEKVVPDFLESGVATNDEAVGLIYPSKLWDDECYVAAKLAEMMMEPGGIMPRAEAEHHVQQAELEEQRRLGREDGQFDAAVNALMQPVSVITGGPGTGKSTTMRVIVRALENAGIALSLACPTGKAAKRLQEASGRPATTIHRQLRYRDGSFDLGVPKTDDAGDETGDVEYIDADMVGDDEYSMADISLAAAQLRAIRPGGRLLIVGDVDQLPSVGPGQVLRDIIESSVIPVARLTGSRRTGEGSGIAIAARRINRGEMPVQDPSEEMRGFEMRPRSDKAIMSEVLRIIREEVPLMGLDPNEDVMVLSPMKEHECGVKHLNAVVKDALNPAHENEESATVRNTLFTVGDVVLQTKNSSKNGVMNGEVGRVVGFETERSGRKTVTTTVMEFDGRTHRFAEDDMKHVEHGFAFTVHKSQGSEKPVVIMVLPHAARGVFMVTRNLVYTGLTRGKVRVFMVGSESTLEAAIERNDVVRRTGLQRRLQMALNPELRQERDDALIAGFR